MAHQIAIGTDFYLFTDNAQGPSPGARNLVISTHGWYYLAANIALMFDNTRVTVPHWTTLHFYTDHQYPLKDPTITKHAFEARFIPTETKRPHELVINYNLGKYQGTKHNTVGESYESLRAAIDGNRHSAARVAEELRIDPFPPREEGQAPAIPVTPAQRAIAGDHYLVFDILTVRNRYNGWGDSPTLKQALYALNWKGWRYPVIHCAFCRNNKLGKSPAGQVPQRRQGGPG